MPLIREIKTNFHKQDGRLQPGVQSGFSYRSMLEGVFRCLSKKISLALFKDNFTECLKKVLCKILKTLSYIARGTSTSLAMCLGSGSSLDPLY